MNKDEYGEIINGLATYQKLADELETHGRVMIGWTDEQYTHLDILFCIQVPFFGGQIQRGLRPSSDLLVAISGFGVFGFRIWDDEVHPSYVAEKLFHERDPLDPNSASATPTKVAELINGVRKQLLS